MQTSQRHIIWLGEGGGWGPGLRTRLTSADPNWAVRWEPALETESAVTALRAAVCAPLCAVIDLDRRGRRHLELLKKNWVELPRMVVVDGAEPPLRELVNRWQISGVFGPADAADLEGAVRALEQDGARVGREAVESLVDERTRLLSRAKREWELTFDAIGTPLALVDDQGVIRRANLETARVAGLDIRQVPGRHYTEVLYGEPDVPAACPVKAVIEGRAQATGEVAVAGGRVLVVSAFRGIDDTAIVCTTSDVTAERVRQRSAMHTEKMVALGQLVGGVAHEINNPLATILAFANLMRGDPGRTSDDLEALDAIEQAAQRARRIVDSMLRFSRRETSVREVDLSEIVGEAGALFHVQAKQKPRVMFVKELAEGLPKVMLNAGQIEQVVLNLLQNALNALPDAAGTIGVRTEAVAGALRLTVWDTGVGIPPEHLARIFEVGFTTKSEGSGTGFGLAIVSSIVEAHKGVVRVESTVGQGTRFIIDFPLQEVGHGE